MATLYIKHPGPKIYTLAQSHMYSGISEESILCSEEPNRAQFILLADNNGTVHTLAFFIPIKHSIYTICLRPMDK